MSKVEIKLNKISYNELQYLLIDKECKRVELELENKQLKDNWNKLKDDLWNLRNIAFTKEIGNEWNNCLSFNEDVLPIINKMQELEKGDSNE